MSAKETVGQDPATILADHRAMVRGLIQHYLDEGTLVLKSEGGQTWFSEQDAFLLQMLVKAQELGLTGDQTCELVLGKHPKAPFSTPSADDPRPKCTEIDAIIRLVKAQTAELNDALSALERLRSERER